MQVVFVACKIVGEARATAEYTAQLWIDQMVKSANGTEDDIEKVFCSVVADNTSVNPNAGRIVEQKFPKLFFNGCRSHCGDLLMEDIAKIPEIDLLLGDAKIVAKFVLEHSRVKAAFSRIATAKGSGTLPKLFPDTRFAYADKTLESMLGKNNCNIEVIQALMQERCWLSETCHGIATNKVEAFASIVTEASFFKKVQAVRIMSSCISAFIHHLETPGTRASFLFPLFAALVKDIEVWSTSIVVNAALQKETITQVVQAIGNRWTGDGHRQVGLYSSQYLLAMILDPSMNCPHNQLPPGWEDECREILERFYPEPGDDGGDEDEGGHAFIVAISELQAIAGREGAFGRHVEQEQKMLLRMVGAPPSHQMNGHVAHMIKTQKAAMKLTPSRTWNLSLGKAYPEVCDIALRLLSMATQSADVERVCKAHKIVHSKVRNRLVNKNVQMLLYCYVNLRLIKTLESRNGRSNIDANDHLEDFLGQAIILQVENE